MAYKDIAGQWCGDVTDYVFTPNTLTVKFRDGRPANAFKITKYTYTNDSVSIDWEVWPFVFDRSVARRPWFSTSAAEAFPVRGSEIC